MKILTERLELRPFISSDINFLYNMDNNKLVNKFRSTDKRTMEFCESQIHNWQTRYSDDFLNVYLVTLKDSSTPIGLIHLVKNSANQVELGYRQLDNYWGKGYMQEAARKLIKMHFERYAYSIFAITHYDNLPSINLLIKLGFSQIDSSYEQKFRSYLLSKS